MEELLGLAKHGGSHEEPNCKNWGGLEVLAALGESNQVGVG